MLKAEFFNGEIQMKKLAALTGVMLMAAAEAMAQDKAAKPARRIVVSIPDRKLAVLEAGRVVKIFPTAVGAPKSPSPAGSYTIVLRLTDPTWYGKGKIVPPGKSSPIGTRWLGLSVKGYGIHGTNNPHSIGHNASHGCIRLRNQDIEQLFGMVSVGDAVELIGERTVETAQIFGPAAVAQAQKRKRRHSVTGSKRHYAMLAAVKGWQAVQAAVIGALLLPIPGAWAADDLNTAAVALARKTAALAGRGEAVAVAYKNMSSLAPAEWSGVRTAFESALRDAGCRALDSQAQSKFG